MKGGDVQASKGSVSARCPDLIALLSADHLDQVCPSNWSMTEQGMLGKRNAVPTADL